MVLVHEKACVASVWPTIVLIVNYPHVIFQQMWRRLSIGP